MNNKIYLPRSTDTLREKISLLMLFYLTFNSAALVAVGKIKKILPGGIVYPSFNSSALINPAAIPSEWATSLETLYNPPTSQSEPHVYSLSVATSVYNQMGFSVGYLGSLYQSIPMHGFFLGSGLNFGPVAFGASVREANLQKKFSPQVDLGVSIGSGHGLQLAATLYQVEKNSQWGAGLGYAGTQFNFEADVLFPAIKGGTKNTYVLSWSWYPKHLGFQLGSLLERNTKPPHETSLRYLAGFGIWLHEDFHMVLQWASPKYFTIGMAVSGTPLTLRKLFHSGRARRTPQKWK